MAHRAEADDNNNDNNDDNNNKGRRRRSAHNHTKPTTITITTITTTIRAEAMAAEVVRGREDAHAAEVIVMLCYGAPSNITAERTRRQPR
jgi:hypothetical protein